MVADKPECSSLSSIDEEQQLRALAERMGQLSVQGDQEKATGREDNGKASAVVPSSWAQEGQTKTEDQPL